MRVGRWTAGAFCQPLLSRSTTNFSVAAKRYFRTVDNTFKAGDSVILKRPEKPDTRWLILSLCPGEQLTAAFGSLNHEDIIGKQARDRVISSKNVPLRAFKPTLAEYVTSSPRLVTPIYPADANLIVSLLDIHVSPSKPRPQKDKISPSLEILEAGTGHGSLTLHLARAIHAANDYYPLSSFDEKSANGVPATASVGQASKVDVTAVAEELSSTTKENATSTSKLKSQSQSMKEEKLISASKSPQVSTIVQSASKKQVHLQQPAPPDHAFSTSWKSKRRAIIHTVEASEKHSKHSESIAYGFRNGIYANNIDFHVGDVGDFVRKQFAERNVTESIFDHAILDLPGVHNYIEIVAKALKEDGVLLVFAPSVTQIARCVDVIRRHRLPLSYEDVFELGPGYTGGKRWDVRVVQPSTKKPTESTPEHIKEAYYANTTSGDGGEENDSAISSATNSSETSTAPRPKPSLLEKLRLFLGRRLGFEPEKTTPRQETTEDDWVFVCRPAVGGRVVGGGFVGMWRKKRGWDKAQIDDPDE